MPGIDNVGAAFKAFMGSISHERKAIISTLNNGFEGWLKLEFYTWLIQAYDLDYTAAHYHDRDAGMEYTIDLDQRQPNNVTCGFGMVRQANITTLS